MPSLKRGLERGSCDFCFRRKVKCDRQTRAAQGFDTCSQCDVRGGPCRLDDSDDIRIQRRRTAAGPGGGSAGVVIRGRRTLSGDVHRDAPGLPSEPPGSPASTPHPVNAGVPAAYDSALPPQDLNDFFLGDAFFLSNDSLFFLDQVFMGENVPTEWNDGVSTAIEGEHIPDRATESIESRQAAGAYLDRTTVERTDDEHPQSAWLNSFPNASIITAAMHAYFDFAASYLPILLADAFWADFNAERCSTALLYAVACRGMPFTTTANKWDLEQELARGFREAFLEARAAVIDDGAVRLDDLEALALMIDFEYDDAGNSAPLQANLGRLFLTHESLVLMLLRSQKHEFSRKSDVEPPLQEPLAWTTERRVLLYWHVYGIDAFHTLDRREQSRIPDLDALSSERISQHEAGDYFDSILALAIIARKVTQTMCSVAAKRRGIKPKDVKLMYEQLAHWRLHSCPKHLRRCRDGAGNLVAGDNSNNDAGPAQGEQQHLQLRRAVLWALELNCTMQIEACVSESRLQADGGLETEQAALQVQFESLRAVTEMRDICKWMHNIEAENDRAAAARRHSLADLAPTALRNICAGLCFWTCQHGIDGFGRGNTIQTYMREGSREGEQVKLYKETAQLLRNYVATAVSHKDTAQVLERLDRQYALLETLVEPL